MTLGRITRIALLASLAVLLSAFLANSGSHPAAKVQPQSGSGGNCMRVGGSIITNFGAVDANTTLGPATGDLRGAVAATVLSITPNPDGTVSFHVHHHWGTGAGAPTKPGPA